MTRFMPGKVTPGLDNILRVLAGIRNEDAEAKFAKELLVTLIDDLMALKAAINKVAHTTRLAWEAGVLSNEAVGRYGRMRGLNPHLLSRSMRSITMVLGTYRRNIISTKWVEYIDNMLDELNKVSIDS